MEIFGHPLWYTKREPGKIREQEVQSMKGYFVADGYMGYVNGSYLLFADESDYREFLEEE